MAQNASIAYVRVETGATYNTVAEVGSATLTLEGSPVDVTEWNDVDANFLYGVRRARIDLDLYFDVTSAQHTTIENHAAAGTTENYQFGLTFPPTPTVRVYTALGIVTAFSIVAQAGQIIRARATIQLVGTITIT
jgi:hypothetical protein